MVKTLLARVAAMLVLACYDLPAASDTPTRPTRFALPELSTSVSTTFLPIPIAAQAATSGVTCTPGAKPDGRPSWGAPSAVPPAAQSVPLYLCSGGRR